MPTHPDARPPLDQSPWRAWLAWTVVVLTAHALLLAGLPQLSLRLGPQDDADTALGFVTRTIAPEVPTPPPAPRDPPAVPTPKTVAPRAAPVVPAPPPSAAAPPQSSAAPASAPEPDTSATVAASPAATAAAAPPTVAPAAPTPPAPPAPPVKPAAAPEPRPTVARFPGAIRLQYEGRGQEKGYINYYGSAELVWQQDGAQYETKLEISAFGIRLRTWTSKGSLDPAAGLLPTRFGDRPRGAEVAVHFQRDKGIISYSNNHPDLPLQAGAQDKLSALLQLGVMAAGTPELLRPGRHLQFQATDANRAETWDFAVSPPENMELPGGTQIGIRLVKEPTAEFDQKIEVWLAPDMEYLPVRLRITESNGSFSDLLWRKSQKPE